MRESWLGATLYRGTLFPYAACRECASLFCAPMPGKETLAAMYGPSYATLFSIDYDVGASKQPERVLETLAALPAGRFLDFGCGGGALLQPAADRGWTPAGLEFDPDVAAGVQSRTGFRCGTSLEALTREQGGPFDAIHLGDVVEHLTDAEAQLREILGALRPGGHLLAQGPLEAGPSLFTAFMRLSRSLSGRKPAEMPPFHVLLATIKGQRAFFQRLGLEEVEFTVTEVPWPAPARLSKAVLRSPRNLILFLVRRLSQAVSRLSGGKMGNRYFYVGRVNPRRS